ncbi:MAG: TIGR00282 family metallophosphoesterase [Candidatus Fermentithermobacillus carboniphilus]|uniref:TIGR00282 family metallophosphoesterase n=1 Tax=Candidatus Fermentithermobacillus carboniphilus TaxID=3085328 RepID=A0AAT9LFR5_9FIRM|nr:MAG: TIGR00282 family metallophosphoesterase [Candidatus Fermentithermobacillus carboniphilus]
MVNLLFIGDVFGSPGREFLKLHLPSLISRYEANFVVVNGENAAGGNGLTPEVAQELFSYGVDVLTSGNHIWDKKEILPVMDTEQRILRPLNYPPGIPGRGSGVFQSRDGDPVGVINVCGRVFSPQNLDCPFRALDVEISRLKTITPVILVDFHAEATSEKVAAGWYVDGRVSALLGTHTHVQTADEIVLPNGTGYITDVGMTGSYEGVIGVKKDIILKHFLTQLPVRHEAAKGKRQLSGVFCRIDSSGKCEKIERILIRE